MFNADILNPFLYSLQLSFYSSPQFWGFYVSPPRIFVEREIRKNIIVKEQLARG